MTDRYENIRKALEMGPTPGPYKQSEFTPQRVDTRSGSINIAWYCNFDNGAREAEAEATAALIAACDPDTLRELLKDRDTLAQENEALRRCAIKYLGWLNIITKPLNVALREDMADPDMCGDAALNPHRRTGE